MTYSDKIEKLKDNQVFCFGSNPVGINGNPVKGTGGSALFANINGWVKSGEKMDNCLSECGKAWGIVTIKFPGKRKSVSLDEIYNNVRKLYEFASMNSDKEFLIAYTGYSNYNLNGYTNKELSTCFNGYIPDNIIFEEEFSKLILRK